MQEILTHKLTAAFDSLHYKLSTNYAFTDWKAINWNELYSEFQPKIAAAETASDTASFYLSIREYLYRIPDGHISLNGWNDKYEELKFQQVGGSYGFALTKLDNGKFCVRLVPVNLPAASAGIEFGAEIIEINDKPTDEALQNVSVLWSLVDPATQEDVQLNKYRFIGRAAVGDTMKVKYINPGETASVTTELIAVDDNYLTLNKTSLSCARDTLPFISYKILEPEGYGYIQLTSLGASDEDVAQIYSGFSTAIDSFLNENVSGLILDLRINEGGEGYLAAALSGFFYEDTTFYESVSALNKKTGQFEIAGFQFEHYNSKTGEMYINPDYPNGTYFIEPPALRFRKPVVIMNSPRQISSGEGVAMALQKLPQCKVVSLYGSHGSFGIVTELENAVWIYGSPNPLFVEYPYGRSLDANKIIQVDSDYNLIGGVVPDERPPLDENAIDKMFVQNIDYELEYARQYLNTIVSVNNENNDFTVTSFELSQNYPNPFNPTTKIKYEIPAFTGMTNVRLKIYDVLGNEVATLVNEEKSPGRYEVTFDGSKLASGIYFYRLQAGSFTSTKKLILMK